MKVRQEIRAKREASKYLFWQHRPLPPLAKRHVHFLHVDGVVPALFEALLNNGQLPHFQFLKAHGQYSNQCATVDKSETMKVIQAYATATRETEVTGWWQFQRDRLRFVNFDTHPIGLLDYILGLQFPLRPTLFDILTSQQDHPIAGFSLHRRSVAFENYSCNYYEGIQGALKHLYFHQAHATMSSFLKLLVQKAQAASVPFPRFSTTLLATVDEFAHWHGLVAAPNMLSGFLPRTGCDGEYCLDRGNPVYEPVFQYVDAHNDAAMHPVMAGLESAYFTHLDRDAASGQVLSLCFKVPKIKTFAQPCEHSASAIGMATLERVSPSVVLAMMVMDLHLGWLINTLRCVRPESTPRYNPAWGNGLLNYLHQEKLEDSLWERTLFLIMGDHGFVDTKHGMSGDPQVPAGFHPDSLRQYFVQYLNHKMGLETVSGNQSIEGRFIGIDDKLQPASLSYPHLNPGWQNQSVQRKVGEAVHWATLFLQDLREALRAHLHEKYWYFLFLKAALIDAKLDNHIAPYQEPAIHFLTQLYLQGDSEYTMQEHQALKRLYNQQIRLVYGGAARSNAELFIPGTVADQLTWEHRPGFSQILSYQPNAGGITLLEALSQNPGIGLIFIRQENALLSPDQPLPATMHITVYDRFKHSGTITVSVDPPTLQRLFHYQKDPDSLADPLGIESLSSGSGTCGTYDDWNEWSLVHQFYYHNVVAGMGEYLYSRNPAIGDVTLMHSQGWNFYDNGGSHGGVHREEKLSIFLASGPMIAPGELFARGRYTYHPKDGVQHQPVPTHPTVLEMAPTTLAWLGYPPDIFADYARHHFAHDLRHWVKSQKADLLHNLDRSDDLNHALAEIGFPHLRIAQFRQRLERLLQFMPAELPALPSFENYRIDGKILCWW